jgi:hypothetical protein
MNKHKDLKLILNLITLSLTAEPINRNEIKRSYTKKRKLNFNMPDDHFINWKQFEPARLTMDKVLTKMPPPKTETDPTKKAEVPQPYQQADWNYLYLLPDGKEIKDSFIMELCDMRCFGLEISDKGKYTQYQCKGSFNKNTPEIQACIDMLNLVHCRMVDLICEPNTKMALRATNVDADLAKRKGTVFKKLVFFALDKATGEVDYNKNPSQYYKLSNYEASKTKFTVPTDTGKIDVLDWDIIKNAEYTGRPLIKYSHVYSNGAGTSCQAQMVSMAITDIKSRGSTILQKDTLSELAKNPEMVNQVSQGLASIRDRLDQLSASGPKNAGTAGSANSVGKPLTSTPVSVPSGSANVNYSGPITATPTSTPANASFMQNAQQNTQGNTQQGNQGNQGNQTLQSFLQNQGNQGQQGASQGGSPSFPQNFQNQGQQGLTQGNQGGSPSFPQNFQNQGQQGLAQQNQGQQVPAQSFQNNQGQNTQGNQMFAGMPSQDQIRQLLAQGQLNQAQTPGAVISTGQSFAPTNNSM